MLKIKVKTIEILGKQFKALISINKVPIKVHGSFSYKQSLAQGIIVKIDQVLGLKSIDDEVDLTPLTDFILDELEHGGYLDGVGLEFDE